MPWMTEWGMVLAVVDAADAVKVNKQEHFRQYKLV